MLRVDPVADREEGLWPAARDVHGAWPRPQKKARTDRKSLVKYLELLQELPVRNYLHRNYLYRNYLYRNYLYVKRALRPA